MTACMLQLVIGDSPLRLNLLTLNVSGTFQMGQPTCPIQSLITVFVPGGNSNLGVFALSGATFDIHGFVAVSEGVQICPQLDSVEGGILVTLMLMCCRQRRQEGFC